MGLAQEHLGRVRASPMISRRRVGIAPEHLGVFGQSLKAAPEHSGVFGQRRGNRSTWECSGQAPEHSGLSSSRAVSFGEGPDSSWEDRVGR